MRLVTIPNKDNRGYTLINRKHIVKVEVCHDEGQARAYGSPIPSLLHVGIYLSTGETVWTTRTVYDREFTR